MLARASALQFVEIVLDAMTLLVVLVTLWLPMLPGLWCARREIGPWQPSRG